MRLTGPEFALLQDALIGAFENFDKLGTVLRRGGENINLMASPGSMDDVTRKVIEHFEVRDRIDQLVLTARAGNQTNRELIEVAAALGLEPAGVAVSEQDSDQALIEVQGSLERIVAAQRDIADFGSYGARIQEFLRRICAVELGANAGTGFLIGPDTVLTNHHVIAAAREGSFDPARIVLRFDYQRARDGRTTNAGVEVHLADEWLVDWEPHSPADLHAFDPDRLPADSELDYAVLRTGDRVGDSPPSTPFDGARGWFSIPAQDHPFEPDSFLMIVQHPCNDPIAYDSADDAVIRVNGNSTRVHYRVNTRPGSSGSPIVNRDLELVGLHHGGEPGTADRDKPCGQRNTPAAYNEGIPIAKIAAHLSGKGTAWVFTPGAP